MHSLLTSPIAWVLGLGILGLGSDAAAAGSRGHHAPRQRQAAPVCTSEVCNQLAAELIRRTTANKTEIDLCEDMEAFVCDSWRAEYTLRPEQGGISYDSVLQDRSNDVIRGFLNASGPPIDTPWDREIFGLVKGAYDTCMDEAEVKRAGVAPLVEILEQIRALLTVDESSYAKLGSTPLTAADSGAIGDVLLHLGESGSSAILSWGVGRDDKAPSVRIVAVTPPPGYTLQPDYYTDVNTMQNYTNAMAKVLAAVHPSKAARDNAWSLAKNVVELEKTLSALLPDLDQFSDVNKYYNIMSLNQTAALAPLLGLDKVIGSLSPAKYTNERMITSFPEVIKSIAGVVNGTSKETLETFLLWNAIDEGMGLVLAPEIEPWRQLKNTLSGRNATAFPDRWRTCVNHVSGIGSLGWILSRFYAAEYFSDKAKALGETLVKYVKQEYERSMDSLDWLDDSVRAMAKLKLQKLGALMGFPDKLPLDVRDPQAVRNFYYHIHLTADSFFSNAMSLSAWKNSRDWSLLGTPYDRGEWLMTAQTVNAYNDPNSNVIAFPAAILQVPYFHAEMPSYLNFGATGWTVGHEVSHAFDNNGRAYDSDGAYGDDWWTPRTDAEFQRRARCLVEQYGNYTVEALDGTQLHLDGEQTLGENIADAGGIDTAFLAWMQHRKDFPEQDTSLKGLEDRWTHEQLFFVGFANSWCSAQTRASLVQQVYGDVHAPARFRVKGTLANSRYFREHFGCKVKEPTCKIW